MMAAKLFFQSVCLMSLLNNLFLSNFFDRAGSHSPVVLFLTVAHEHGFESCTGWSGSRELVNPMS